MSSNKFSFKSFFRKKNKAEDELDHFMKMQAASNNRGNQENQRPRSRNPLDVDATACYHTEVAPRTRRGPKSCPGGVKDEGGIINRSFETEVPSRNTRRRAASPEEIRRRPAFSEYNGHANRGRRDMDYKSVIIEESEGEEANVAELKAQIKDLRRRLVHSQARRSYYKQEYTEAMEIRRSADKAYKAQEDKYKQEIEHLRNRNTYLEDSCKNFEYQLTMERNKHCYCKAPPASYGFGGFNPSSFTMRPSLHSMDSVITDPRPTGDVPHFPIAPLTTDFIREDRDEPKVFHFKEDQSTDLDISDVSQHQMDMTND